MTAEAAALLACLRAQREHVLGVLDGLPERDLRRPVLPSGWSCLGLVRHLALDVERFWFRAVVAGEGVELESGDAAWTVAPDVPAQAVLDLYRHEAELADAVVAATPWTPPRRGGRASCSRASRRATCAGRCCTSSPRPRATPATSTPRGSSSTAAPGWS